MPHKLVPGRVLRRWLLPLCALALLLAACGAEAARVETTLHVDSRRYPCEASSDGCLWVHEDGADWRFLTRAIEGFEAAPGEHAVLRVDRSEDRADDIDADYALLEVLERASGPAPGLIDPFGAESMLQVAFTPGEGLRVARGFLFAPNDAQVRLCGSLTADMPPRCPGEFMLLEGVQLDAIEGLEQDGKLRWSTFEVRVPGTTREVQHLLFGYRVVLDVSGRVTPYPAAE